MVQWENPFEDLKNKFLFYFRSWIIKFTFYKTYILLDFIKFNKETSLLVKPMQTESH